MTIYKSAPGVFDILPFDEKEVWKSSYLWQYFEETARKVAKSFGYEEIRTPIFERSQLFERGVGEGTDIVSKEMYLFEDKGKRSMALRPEGTAPVMRAYLENQLNAQQSYHKLFYLAPMFRYDRPQAGRYRQHHQFGAEAIGIKSPEQDAEIIDLLYTLYNKLGLRELKIYLNCIGTKESRERYREILVDFLKPQFNRLSEDSQRRLEANPLRVLDSKDPADREAIKGAPSILNSLDQESKDYFFSVQEALKSINIPFEVQPQLVRGLDYYNMTVFEVVSGELGAQNSIGGGGRYDGLIKMLGGPDVPSIGFGAGIERALQVMIKQQTSLPNRPSPSLYIIPLGDEPKKKAFRIVHELREKNIAAQMDMTGKKLTKAMQIANQLNAKFSVVIGENEIDSGEVQIKDMKAGTSFSLPLDLLPLFMELEDKSQQLTQFYQDLEIEDEKIATNIVDQFQYSIKHSQKTADYLQEKLETIKQFLEI
ncbi:MAG: histidine--tRNA ligase [Chlamydiales bacterium]